MSLILFNTLQCSLNSQEGLIIDILAPIRPDASKSVVLDLDELLILKLWLSKVVEHPAKRDWSNYTVKTPIFSVTITSPTSHTYNVELVIQAIIIEYKTTAHLHLPILTGLYNIVNLAIDILTKDRLSNSTPQILLEEQQSTIEESFPTQEQEKEIIEPKQEISEEETSGSLIAGLPPIPDNETAAKTLAQQAAQFKNQQQTEEHQGMPIHPVKDIVTALLTEQYNQVRDIIKQNDIRYTQIRDDVIEILTQEHNFSQEELEVFLNKLINICAGVEEQPIKTTKKAKKEQTNKWLDLIQQDIAPIDIRISEQLTKYVKKEISLSTLLNSVPANIKMDVVVLSRAISSNDMEAWNRRVTSLKQRS